MFWKRISPAIIWAIVIAFLSGAPGESLPKVEFWDFISFDKAAHFFVYGLLTYLLAVGFCRQTTYRKIKFNGRMLAIFAAFIYGTILEVLQYTVFPGRTFEWDDIIANTIGCITGILIFSLVFGDSLKDK